MGLGVGMNQPEMIDIGGDFSTWTQAPGQFSVPFIWALRTQPGRAAFYEVGFMAHAHTQMCRGITVPQWNYEAKHTSSQGWLFKFP